MAHSPNKYTECLHHECKYDITIFFCDQSQAFKSEFSKIKALFSV